MDSRDQLLAQIDQLQKNVPGLIDQARKAAENARTCRTQGRIVESVSAYGEALEQLRVATTYDVSEHAHEELQIVLKQFLELLDDELIKKKPGIEQGKFIIEAFWPRPKHPSYLHSRVKEHGFKSPFDLVCDYLESCKQLELLYELLEAELSFAIIMMETVLIDQLLERLERLAEHRGVDVARRSLFLIRYYRALVVKQLEEYQKAKCMFEDLLSDSQLGHLHPVQEATIYRQIGECEVKLGLFEEAAKTFQKGAEELDHISDPLLRGTEKAFFGDFTSEAKAEMAELRKKSLEDILVAHSESAYSDKATSVDHEPSGHSNDEKIGGLNIIAGASADAWDLSFKIVAEPDDRIFLGDYVILTHDGKKLFGQIETSEENNNRRVHRGTLLRTVSEPAGPLHPVLNEGSSDRVAFSGGQVELAGAYVLEQYVSTPIDKNYPLFVGTLSQVYASPPIEVVLNHGGFGHHTALFGQSGSGKSFALGRLLEELLRSDSFRIVLLDPNSDYRKILHTEKKDKVRELWQKVPGWDRGTSRDKAKNAHISKADKDYNDYQSWLDEHSDRICIFTHQKAVPEIETERAFAIKLRLSDVDVAYQASLLHLNPVHHPGELSAYRDAVGKFQDSAYDAYKIEEVLKEYSPRSPDIARVLSRLQNARLSSLSIWETIHTTSETLNPSSSLIAALKSKEWQLLELDIGDLKPVEKQLVSFTILERLWDQHKQESQRPTLIVIDEAHHLVPRGSDSPQAVATANIINEIAGEGRKYGLFLLVASQAPSKLHPFTLSQCSNLILMKMQYETDLAVVRDAFSQVPAGAFDQAKAFQIGEALIIGNELVRSPLCFRFVPRRSMEGRIKIKIPHSLGI
ncbi:MAG: ATP-binding protein [Desulfomonilaceae bacterium]